MKRIFIITVLLFLGPIMATAQSWRFVQTPHSRVFTDGDQNKSRKAALRIEQLRMLFGMLLQREEVVCNVPVRIVLLANTKEFQTAFPIVPSDDSVGEHSAYIKTDTGDFIAVDISSLPAANDTNAWPELARGMAFRLLDGNYPRTPAWFDIGFAEYFSTIRLGDKEAKIGTPSVRVMEALQEGEWIPSVKLLSQEYKPATEVEKARYRAQAWLFLHFIYSDKRIEQLGDYFRLIMSEKRSASQAIKEAFQIDADQLDKVLKAYRLQGAKDASSYPPPGTLAQDAFPSDKLPEPDGSTQLAQIRMLRAVTASAGEVEMQKILMEYPHQASANEALGAKALADGDFTKALPLLRRANAQEDGSPRAAYLYAWLLRKLSAEEKPDPEKLFAQDTALMEGLREQPEFAAIHVLRAQVLREANNMPGALRAIRQAVKLQPRVMRNVYELAFLEASSRHYDEAESLLGSARSGTDPELLKDCDVLHEKIVEWRKKPILQQGIDMEADTPKEWRRKNNDNPLDDTNDAKEDARREAERNAKPDKRPVKNLKGTIESIDCSLQPAAVLHVNTSKQPMTLRVADVKTLVLIGAERFDCTWSKKKVNINYKANSASNGDVVSIEID